MSQPSYSTAPPHIEALVHAAVQTLEALFGAPPQLGSIQMVMAGQREEQEVNVAVGFTGTVSGQVLLGLSREVALSLASHLIMSEAVEFDELVVSALGEVGNLVAAAAAIRLHEHGMKCDITVPTVILGDHLQVRWPNLYVQKLPLSLAQGSLELTIGLKTDRSKM